MANTCNAYDSSAPRDVLEGIKRHLKRKPNPRKHLDADGSCMLEDLDGTGCGKPECQYGDAQGKKEKKKRHDPHDPI